MARRAAGHRFGDPELRAAVVAKRTQLAEAFPGAFVELLRAAVEGEPLTLSTAALGGALAAAGHPDWREFTLDADRGNSRTWLLDDRDVLTELTG
jgi:hypothetical protein